MTSSSESTKELFREADPASHAGDAYSRVPDSSEETFINFRWVFPDVLEYPSVFDSTEVVEQFLKDHSISEQETGLVILPCGKDDRVCDRPAEGEPDYFFVYTCLFTRFSISLPFSTFICSVLDYFYIAPTQLMLNAW